MTEYLKSSIASFTYSFRFARTQTTIAILIAAILAFVPYFNSFGLSILLNWIGSLSKDDFFSIDLLLIILVFSLMGTIPEILRKVLDLVNKQWIFTMSEKLEVMILQKKNDIDITTHESPDFQNLMQRALHKGVSPIIDLTEFHFDMIRLGVSFTIGSILAWNISPMAYLILITACIPQSIVHYKYGLHIWNIRAEDSPEQRRFLDLRKYFNSGNIIIETKLFQTGPKLIEWIQSILKKFHLKHIKYEKKKVLFSLATEIFFMIGISICIYLIIKRFFDFDWKLGNLVFAIGTFQAAGVSIRHLFVCVNKQHEEHLSVRDILTFFNIPTEAPIKQEEHADFKLNNAPEIVFDNVGFKYPSANTPILNGVSFKIAKNKKVALIGCNGSGKSTIIKLLGKIIKPTQGKIYINGQDLNNIDTQKWWSYLAIMLQDNIDYNLPTNQAISIGNIAQPIDNENVMKSAYLTSAFEFIERWPEKYETPLGVAFGGQAPSKGQRQKLSLSKTIYRNAFVTILDEPTTSMDIQSVRFIADNLDDIGREKSLIIVSHDPTIIKRCDEIILIENGTVRVQGTHSELLEYSYYRDIL